MRRLGAIVAVAIVVLAAAAALAYLSVGSAPGGAGGAAATSLTQGATPAVSQTARSVTLTWAATGVANGAASASAYVITRYQADAPYAAVAVSSGTCAGLVGGLTCTESSVPDGRWQYSVTPALGNWRGPVSAKSGVVTIGAAALTLDTTTFAAPLPRTTTGTLTGFDSGEGITFRLDDPLNGPVLTGSPSTADLTGTANVSVTIPAGTADGAHTVYAIGNSLAPSQASAAILVDTTAPTSSANSDALWHRQDVTVHLAAVDGSGGSGVAAIRYSVDGGPVQTIAGAAGDVVVAAPADHSADGIHTITFYSVDRAGNVESPSRSASVKIDTITPVTTDNAPSGWHNTTQTVALTASDPGAPLTGSGVAATYFSTDGSTPATPGTSITLSAEGRHTIKYFSVDNAGNQESVRTAANQVLIDKTSPVPGTFTLPGVIRNGQVLTNAATDGLSGVASVAYYACAGTSCTPTPGGPGTTLIGSSSAGPGFGVTWVSQPADGAYRVVARVTDMAGNVADSAVAATTIDNTGPTATLTDPGSPLRGTVTLNATAGDGTGSGVASVRIQRAPAGSGTWTDVCTDTTSPYSCSWVTTGVADGSYDLRAVAIDQAGNVTTSTIVAARVVDNTPPVVLMTDPDSYIAGTVTLAATATDATSGVASVVIQRSPAGAGSWTTICTDTTVPYSCSLNTATSATPDGEYDFRAIATDGAGNSATDLTTAVIDNTAPTVTLTVPASPLRGIVTFTTSPVDPGTMASGVGSVTVYVRQAGTSTWATACTATSSPWTCAWDSTSVTSGASYEFKAIATDLAGNQGTSSTITRTVDNSVSSVFMNDPGAYIRGTVTLQATVSNAAGSPSVALQISASGANSWTTLCTVTTSPWSCPFDTTTRADGLYDFRAVLTDASGTKTSNTVTSRIDNTLLRATDVQSANASGGTIGRFQAGDSLLLTYNDLVAPGSIVSGWDGTTPLTVYIRLRDGGLLTPKLSGKDDTIDIFTTTALSTAVNVGSVNTKTDLIGGGKSAIFSATLTASGSTATTLTFTVGAMISGGGIRTASDKVSMIWTPSAAAKDKAGNACSTAPVTESGTAHVNF